MSRMLQLRAGDQSADVPVTFPLDQGRAVRCLRTLSHLEPEFPGSFTAAGPMRRRGW